MPKIAAPTLAEHREHVLETLVDSAEAILRGGEALTAGAVSQAAGIARNSIYRYVDSVDDLRALVLSRYLPAWDAAVSQALDAVADPGEQVVEWVRVNLAQTRDAGHGWLMDVARRGAGPSERTREVAEHAHRILRDSLGSAWAGVLPGDAERAGLWAVLTQGLLQTAFQQLDGDRPADLVTDTTVRAARALVEAARSAD